MAKIMVVDDEADVRESIRTLLEGAGLQVVVAENGYECLEKIKDEKPDLVLLDIMMPGIDGKEVCKRIRSNPLTKDTKIVMLTVVKPSELGTEAFKALDITDYIMKPFDNEELIQNVKNLL